MKRSFFCVKLHFSTPLHLSRGRENYDKSESRLHSDSLKSALFVAALNVGADEKEALKLLDGVRISSAFPFCGEEYFFPKPMAVLPFPIKQIEKEKQGKCYKKIQYLSQGWFETLLRGDSREINPSTQLQANQYLCEQPDSAPNIQAQVVQRVTIQPDHSGDSTPFYTERLFFAKDTGLFVLVDWQEETIRDLFKASFLMLGDLGIGTDRSVGNGFFKPEFSEISLDLPQNASHLCSLGLYLPEESELEREELEKSSWSILKRGGFMAGAWKPENRSLRKRSVFMFGEGSVFPGKEKQGKLTNLKPAISNVDHAIWRDGRPIFIPINLVAAYEN